MLTNKHPPGALAFDAGETFGMQVGLRMELQPIPVAATLWANDQAGAAVEEFDINGNLSLTREAAPDRHSSGHGRT